MNKLYSFALHALITPVIALGAGSALAQQPGQDSDRQQQSNQHDEGAQSAQHDQGATQSTAGTRQSDRSAERGNQSAERARQANSQSASDRGNTRGQAREQNRGYLDSAPANSMQASNLIGARVRSKSDEDVGSVNDLIIDEDGQIVAVVFGAGGFLGLGEKNIAIGWDDVTRSGSADEQGSAGPESAEQESAERESSERELRIQVTREDLQSAPEFDGQD